MYQEPIIMLGGDFNNKIIDNLLEAHVDLVPMRAGATRRGRYLDEVYTNVNERVVEKLVQQPLTKVDGSAASDHSIISASIKIPKKYKPVKKKIQANYSKRKGNVQEDASRSRLECY